jgi:hypothetical protein
VFFARTGKPVAARLKSLAVKVDEVIVQLVADPSADGKRQLEAAGIATSDAERVLLRRLPKAAGTEQAVILRMLASCGTPRSVPAILRLARNSAHQAQVLATIEQIVGADRLSSILKSTPDSQMRSAILARLLKFDSDAVQLSYLSLVRDEATRAMALSAAESMAEPPVDPLLNLLEHDYKWVRRSAAIVLGHVNGPVVTEALIARVTSNPSKATEAWVALMTCRGEMAEGFLAYASRRPQLLGYLNNARLECAQTIH